MTTILEDILSILPSDQESAINLRDISTLVHISTREIKYCIQQLRGEGYPVASTTYDGYWIAKDPSDLAHTIKQLECRRNTIDDTIKALQNARFDLEV